MVKVPTAAGARELPFIVFLCFAVLFSWPLVQIVDAATWPSLAVVYFFSVWILAALVLFGVTKILRRRLEDQEDKL